MDALWEKVREKKSSKSSLAVRGRVSRLRFVDFVATLCISDSRRNQRTWSPLILQFPPPLAIPFFLPRIARSVHTAVGNRSFVRALGLARLYIQTLSSSRSLARLCSNNNAPSSFDRILKNWFGSSSLALSLTKRTRSNIASLRRSCSRLHEESSSISARPRSLVRRDDSVTYMHSGVPGGEDG